MMNESQEMAPMSASGTFSEQSSTSLPEIFRREDIATLAKTMYGEARGEWVYVGPSALIAVGNVVMNRWQQRKRFGRTIEDICLQPYQFSCWNDPSPSREMLLRIEETPPDDALSKHVYEACWQAAEGVLLKSWPDLTKGSDHYYADTLPTPPLWARDRPPELHLGHHIFFKLGV